MKNFYLIIALLFGIQLHAQNQITILSLPSTSFCPGSTFLVPILAQHTSGFGAGNVFTAQLSNAAGSFATPTNIGTLNATQSGLISVTIPSATAAGVAYRIRVISSNPSFTGSESSGFQVLALPNVSISAPNGTSFCPGGNVILNSTTPGGVTFQWLSGTSNASGTSNTANYTASTAGNYSLRITQTSTGCSNTSNSISVSSSAQPAAASTAISPAQNTIMPLCGNDSVQLSVPANATLGFQWVRDGLDIAGANSNTYFASLPGTYTMRTSLLSSGCSRTSSTAQSRILENAVNPPVAQFTSTSGNVCQSSSVLTATEVPFAKYFWFKNGAFVDSTNVNSINITSGGLFRMRVRNNCGDTASVVQTINIVANPSVTISATNGAAPTTFCAPGTFSFTANATPVSPATITSRQWRRNGTNVGGATANVFATANQTGNYTILVTDNNGCTATSNSLAITVNPQPAVGITTNSNNIICGADTAFISTAYDVNNIYAWKRNNNSISTDTNQFKITQGGTYTVLVTNNNGCTEVDTQVVVASSYPNANFNPTNIAGYCQGDTNTFTANVYTGASYNWIVNGVSSGDTTNSLTSNTLGFYQLIIVNQNGCADTSNQVLLNVYPNAIATISQSGSASICGGDTVQVFGNVNSTGTFGWLQNNTPIPGANTLSINLINSGSYAFTFTNGFGCSDTTASLNLTVNSNPTVSVTSSGSTTICPGDVVNLFINSADSGTYSWRRNSFVISAANDTIFGATIGGLYYGILTDTNGCEGFDTISVNVLPAPNVNLTPSALTYICAGSVINAFVPNDTTATYQWFEDGNILINDTLNTLVITTAGLYTVEATGENGCSLLSQVLEVQEFTNLNSSISALGDTTFCLGENVLLNGITISGFSYQWLRDGIALNNETSNSIVANNSGNYQMVVYLLPACFDTSNVITVVAEQLPGPPFITTSGNVLNCENTPGANTYQWYFNDVIITGATSSSYTATQNGVYKVKVTSPTGCINFSTPFSFAVGLEELNALSNIKIAPNPFENEINILGNFSNMSVAAELIDLNGRLIQIFTSNEIQSGKIITNNLESGLYILQIRSANANQRFKVIKR